MDRNSHSVSWDISVIRWIARIAALILFIILALFFFGERGYEAFQYGPVQSLGMILFIIACLGLIIGWRWELTGGLMIVCAISAKFVLNSIAGGRISRMWAFAVIMIPGFLYLISWGITARSKKQS